MNKYTREFSTLKPHDPAQFTEELSGGAYEFIVTAGHGYLIVPKGDEYATLASSIKEASAYSYEGELAWYLEEDCDASQFLKRRKEFISSRVLA